MKRELKKINLKKDTLIDIEANNIDTNSYIERINEYLNKAYFLINNKMENMNSSKLYDSLNEVFNIYFEPNDYLKILSLMNNKHYSKYVMINTYMYDENDYNVSYLCATTNKSNILNNDKLDLNKIRKLTESNDLILLKPNYKKNNIDESKKEKFESHLYNYINIFNDTIDEKNTLYPYATQLLKKELIIKNVLYDLKIYIDEVMHQIKEINDLSRIKDDIRLANIGKKYKKAYVMAVYDDELPRKEKISVRYHQKTKNRKI